MITICSSLLSLVCHSSSQMGLNYLSFFRTFLHTNSWYCFVLWYNSTLSVHIHYFGDYMYIFHVHILVTGSTCCIFLQRLTHMQAQILSSTSLLYIDMVLIYTMVAVHTNVYIRDILQRETLLQILVALFDEHCQSCLF